MISKSGVMTRIDLSFHDFLLEIQEERRRLKIDGRQIHKLKPKKSLTELTFLCWKILMQKQNMEKLLLKNLSS